MIYNLVLASGSGSRLYPLSTEEKPKQFLKLISDQMILLDTVERFKDLTDSSVVVTLDKYIKHIDFKTSLIDMVVMEEERKGTAHTVYEFLKQFKDGSINYDKDTIIVQTPSDHFVSDKKGFDKSIEEAIENAKGGSISCVGVKPRYNDSEFGYVKAGKKMNEKPSAAVAKMLMNQGYNWNTGIYVYRVQDMIDLFEFHFYGEEHSFEDTILNKVNMKVVKGNFKWQDLGNHDRLKDYESIWGWRSWQKRNLEERENKEGLS